MNTPFVNFLPIGQDMNCMFIGKKKSKYIFLIVCSLVFAFMAYLNHKAQGKVHTDMDNFSVKSYDSALVIQWRGAYWQLVDCVEITISNGDDSFKIDIPPLTSSYTYKEGKHGELYTVTAVSRFRDGTYGEEFIESALFLDYGMLPGIPLISITTFSGSDPSYEVAAKPDNDLWGATITDNEYVSGELIMDQAGKSGIVSQVKIRVRGNTSSVGSEKIVLNIMGNCVDIGLLQTNAS